jgi:hypothetical protein
MLLYYTNVRVVYIFYVLAMYNASCINSSLHIYHIYMYLYGLMASWKRKLHISSHGCQATARATHAPSRFRSAAASD